MTKWRMRAGWLNGDRYGGKRLTSSIDGISTRCFAARVLATLLAVRELLLWLTLPRRLARVTSVAASGA
jgi:hypothetical protein